MNDNMKKVKDTDDLEGIVKKGEHMVFFRPIYGGNPMIEYCLALSQDENDQNIYVCGKIPEKGQRTKVLFEMNLTDAKIICNDLEKIVEVIEKRADKVHKKALTPFEAFIFASSSGTVSL